MTPANKFTISESIQITLNNNYLWVFGFFMALQKWIREFTNNAQSGLLNQILYSDALASKKLFNSELMQRFFNNPKGFLITFVLFGFIMYLVGVGVSSFLSGSLIGMVREIDFDRKLSIKNGFDNGIKHFKKIFSISFILFSPLLLIYIPIIVFLIPKSLIIANTVMEMLNSNYADKPEIIGRFLEEISYSTSGAGIFLPLSCVIIFITLVLMLVSIFSVRVAVFENLIVVKCISKGWLIIKTHFWETIKNMFIFTIIYIIVSTSFSLPQYLLNKYYQNNPGILYSQFNIIPGITIPMLLFILLSLFGMGLIYSFSTVLVTKLYLFFNALDNNEANEIKELS